MRKCSNKKVKRVLVAPLDWGLGHATRCIPIIRALLQQQMEVFLAGEGAVKSVLQEAFPQLPWLQLKGYGINYGKSAAKTWWALLRQMPKIKAAIQYEQAWLQQVMPEYHFDAVISDNRFGLHHPEAQSIFITHQLQIQTPLAGATRLLQQINYRYINRFDACWVPDFPGSNSLAGRLSHPKTLPAVPVHYIGPLSRFSPEILSPAHQGPLLLLLSGPEPQRTLLEQKLLQQVAAIGIPTVLVQGRPGNDALIDVPPNVQVFAHLPETALAAQIKAARMVICRSGYSTIMDLWALGKKSILIPTPGQTEQQYLARHLHQQGFAIWRRQEDFEIGEALAAASVFNYRLLPGTDTDLLAKAIEQWNCKTDD